MHPRPEPFPELDPTVQQGVLTAEINPSVVLMNVPQSLTLLLSRNTLLEPNLIRLYDVRSIDIPLGWLLKLTRFFSRFCRVRLPDEFEIATLQIDISPARSAVALEKPVIGHVKDLNFMIYLIQLTGAEYRSLCHMNGRMLCRWVAKRLEP